MKPYEVFYLSENGIITADSIPDLDEWGWDEWWKCSEWVAWHKANKRKYGLEIANQKFAEYWNKQTIGAGALDCRTFNTEFRQYVKANGLSGVVWEGAGIFSVILDPIGTGSDVITEVSKGVSAGAKILRIAIPVVILGGLAFFGINAYKSLRK